MRWLLIAALVAFVTFGASRSAACALPWESMEQVRTCGAPRYTLEYAGEQQATIVVDSKSPWAIAAALAHAFTHEYRLNSYGFSVWAQPVRSAEERYTGRMLLRMHSGLVSEQGNPDGPLHFDICTAWTDLSAYDPGVGSVCADQLEFWIER